MQLFQIMDYALKYGLLLRVKHQCLECALQGEGKCCTGMKLEEAFAQKITGQFHSSKTRKR